MAFAFSGEGAPDYAPCRYGASRLVFRGPARTLRPGYIAALGGAETYGKFVHEPFPALLEGLTGREVVNLGVPGAGPDVFLEDPEVSRIASQAAAVVLQVPGTANLSNRFYAVHPRRNDRFLSARPDLVSLFPEIDLTEVHFTGHLVRLLALAGGRRFETVAETLRRDWVARMGRLLSRPGVPVVLLWLADHPPPLPGFAPPGDDPVPVDAGMIAAVARNAAAVVETIFDADRPEDQAGKAFAPLDRAVAARVPGPLAHAETALALWRALAPLLEKRGRA